MSISNSSPSTSSAPLVIQAPARLSRLESADFKAQCLELLFSSDTISQSLCLDLSQTNFLDSSGLGVLISLERLIQEKNGSLILRNPGRAVMMVLELVSLDQVVKIERIP